MSEFVINVVTDFSDTPGGRLRAKSEKSGEEFREDFLRPALAKADVVRVLMNGASGYPHSFLDESFGALMAELGVEVFDKRIKWELTDNSLAIRRMADIRQKRAR